MTIKELIELFKKYPDDYKVTIGKYNNNDLEELFIDFIYEREDRKEITIELC